VSKQQRGAAVILAILIVALAASTAAFAVWQQSLWTRQMENLTERSKADALALSTIELARGILIDKDKSGKPLADFIAESGSQTLSTPAEGASINGLLVELQGRFDLNNLALAAGNPHQTLQLDAFRRLLDSLHLKPELAKNVADWLDSSADNTTADLYYLGLDPPYRAAKQRFTDVSELARVKDFDADTLRKLAPFVTALPCVGTPGVQATCESALNVNTAAPEVLAAVFAMSPDVATTIIEARKKKIFANKAEFTTLWNPPQGSTTATLPYDTKCQFFLANVKVASGRVQAGYSALLTTITGASPGGDPWPGIIWIKEVAN
jgi:general secretion pathway protein K